MTPDEAKNAVHRAMLKVDPEYQGQPGRVGNMGVRVEQRGNVYDVLLVGADYLFDEFATAIFNELREFSGFVKDMESGSVLSSKSSSQMSVARSIIAPTINNYGSIGAQQFGDRNAAHVSQSINIDQRSLEQVVQAVRVHLAEFSDENREEAEHHLETITEELEAPNPRPTRLRGALRAIRRLTPLAGAAAKAAIETAIEAAMKGLLSAHGS